MDNISAIVEYDYTAKESDELDLRKGAIIQHIEQMPGGWWKGTLKSTGETGMFPDNFVRVLDNNSGGSSGEDGSVQLRDKSTTKNRRYKVIYSYTQVNRDELTLAVGDVIEFLGEVEQGWWRGRLKNQVGVFPSNFVEQIEPSPILASKRPQTTILDANSTITTNATKIDNTTVNNATKTTAAKTATTTTTKTTAAAATTGATTTTTTKKLNRLSYHSSKEDLLNSISSGNSGTTSSSTFSTTTLGVGDSIANDEAVPLLPPKPHRDYCRVEFAYEPQNDDELELKVGDVITIISMELPDKGWWRGELRGKVGVFPDNFVKLLPPSEGVAPLNDTALQQNQRTAKPTNTVAGATAAAVTTAANTTTHLSNNTASTTVKVFIKKSGSTSSTQSSNRKDSFGSRDSLNDILSETGLPTGNVAAQRKSLENKNIDITNASDANARLALKKQQQQQQQKETITTTTSTISSSNSSSSSMTSAATSQLRKSLDNLDEKAKSPPPVLTKKPTVPTKKSTTVTSVAGNLLSGFKQKVKNVETKLTTAVSHDYADGIGSSKLSPSMLPDEAPAGNVVMRRAATIAVEDTEFDHVERGSMLADMRAGRVKAPKRRPPSAAINVLGESNNNSVYVNGSGMTDSVSELSEDGSLSGGGGGTKSDDNSTGEEQLAKPRPREWEKKKAPWMEELKASQVRKKTSPNVEPRGASVAERTSKLFADEFKAQQQLNNLATSSVVSSAATSSISSMSTAVSSSALTSASSAATSTTTKVQSNSITSSSLLQQSMNIESSSQKETNATTTTIISSSSNHSNSSSSNTINSSELMSKSMNSAKVIAPPVTQGSSNEDEIRQVRPNSLALRNRSVSPLVKANTNHTVVTTEAASTTTATSSNATSTSHSNSNPTHAATVKTTAVHNNYQNNAEGKNTAATDNARVYELERRLEKLESVVHTQQRTIDELVRTLREETDRVKVLRGELDKYAQCVTQV